MGKQVPVSDVLSRRLIDVFTSLQEAYKLAVQEFALFEIHSMEDVDIQYRLGEDARLLFDRYIQAHLDAKMYMHPREVLDE